MTDKDMMKQNRDDWEHSVGVTQCGLLLVKFSPACVDTYSTQRSMWSWVHSTKLALLVAAIREKFHTALQS